MRTDLSWPASSKIIGMENPDRNFTIVKNSPVHGRGVFARKVIPKGTRILEYTGERVLKANLPAEMAKGLTSLVYVMNLNETMAIDGERGGNDARFINHSCDPNCEVMYFNSTPYIYAMREIAVCEELNFDYQLGFNSNLDLSIEQRRKLYPCNCGSANCRGTLIGE